MFFQLKLTFFSHLRALCLLLPLLVISDHIYAKPIKLVVLGDSLSAAYNLKQEQGWVSLLQNAWKEQDIIVVNAAISGETTDGGLARLPRLLEQHQPTHLLIELGGNDGLRGQSIEKMRANLDKMITLGKQAGSDVMLQQIEIPTNYGRRYNQMFRDTYSSLAEKHKIPLIPFFLQEIAFKPDCMMADGIHPNAKAQPHIANFMQQQLENTLFSGVTQQQNQ